jgi:Glycosyl transferase family 2
MTTKVATVTTIKAPLNETLMFVNYHLNIGVSHMFLFFDDPNDVAIEAVANYEKVTSIKCDSKYWDNLSLQPKLIDKSKQNWTSLTSSVQLEEKTEYFSNSTYEKQLINANYAFNLAQQDGCDWLIHIDSDELIYVKQPLDVLLSKVGENINVLVIEPSETVPEQDEHENFFEEVTLFKNKESLWQKYLAYFLGCKGVFQEGYYFRGHPYGKSAIRTNTDIQSVDIHYPIIAEGKKVKAKKFRQATLLHFDCCSFKTWKRKLIRRYEGTTTFPNMRSDRKKQLAKFAEVYESGNNTQLRELYHQQYLLSNYERKALGMLGLLKRIQLDPKLFQKHSLT